MVIVAAWFAIIHFRPVEYPGLFVFGLVLGTCALRTRRLGMGVLTHMAFNATGLVLVVGRCNLCSKVTSSPPRWMTGFRTA